MFFNTYADGDFNLRQKSISASRISDILYALLEYHKEYGKYPTACQTIEQLVFVLAGGEYKDDNAQKMNFVHYNTMKKIEKLYCVDGYGHKFKLIRSTDGTNLIIRSLGRNGIDDDGKFDDRDEHTKRFQQQQQPKEK